MASEGDAVVSGLCLKAITAGSVCGGAINRVAPSSVMGVPLRKKKKYLVGELDDTERGFDEHGQGRCGTTTLQQTVLYRRLHTVCTTEILVTSAQLVCSHLDASIATYEQRGRAGLVVHEWAGVTLAGSQRESMLLVDPVSQIETL